MASLLPAMDSHLPATASLLRATANRPRGTDNPTPATDSPSPPATASLLRATASPSPLATASLRPATVSPGYSQPPPGYGHPPGHGQMPPPGADVGAPAPQAPEETGPLSVSQEATPGHDAAGSTGTFPGIRRKNSGLRGRLEQLGLSSLLVMLEMERKDGLLLLKNGEDDTVARLFLRKGQVIQARIEKRDDLDGRQSVYAALAWSKGKFNFSAMEVDMEDEIQSTTTGLLMEGARIMDEENR